ncbi:MAG TPA: fructosamine kinase family protein [Streptosporangiaceae bacterium]
MPPTASPAGSASGPVAARLAALTGTPVRDVRPAGAQHGTQHYRATLADGREIFAKLATPGPSTPQSPASPFSTEAHGLRWLAEAGAVPIPEVLGGDDEAVVLSWLPPGPATAEAAADFGRALARLHAAGADQFGAPWPGFIASLPLDNTPWPADQGWPHWYAERRVRPYLRRAAGQGTLGPADVAQVEEVLSRIGDLAGPDEPPSRIHGDCWSGNVLWSGGRGWLIDPAAHGGHRETDLAMLDLFGAPHLTTVLRAYHEQAPLAPGWRDRIPLHQLHPLLVHVCLFGAGYRDQTLAAARAMLASGG